MSEWDERPEIDLTSDPAARAVSHRVLTTAGRKGWESLQAVGRSNAGRKTALAGAFTGLDPHRADRGLRKFSWEADR